MATKKVSQGTRPSKRRAERPIFAAEIQRSAERKALAKLPELAQRAALAAMHLEKASLAQVIKGIELARKQDCWELAFDDPKNIDTYLMVIRVCTRRFCPDVRTRAEVVSLTTHRAAKERQVVL